MPHEDSAPDLVLVRKDEWDALRGDKCLLTDYLRDLLDSKDHIHDGYCCAPYITACEAVGRDLHEGCFDEP